MFSLPSTRFRRSLALHATRLSSTLPTFALFLACVPCISCSQVLFTSLFILFLPWQSSFPLSAPRCFWLTFITSQRRFLSASLAWFYWPQSVCLYAQTVNIQ